jgi:ATP-binding cassette subfamily C protein
LSWRIALGAVAVGLAVTTILRGWVRASRAAGRDQVTVMRSMIARLTEALPNVKPLKAMSREEYVLPLLEGEASGFLAAQRRQVLATETLASFQEPLLVLALGSGLYFVLSYTSIEFATVLALSFLFQRVVGSVNQVQQRFSHMATGEAAFWNLADLIAEAEAAYEPTEGGGRTVPTFAKVLKLEDVSFSYGSHAVLRSVDLEFPAGAFVAVVGPSGSGKTTMVDMIVGLHAPTRGRITVDGVDLREVDMRKWRALIGYVPQEPLLFHDSILKNVTLGDESIPPEAVRRALEAAGAWGFVSALPAEMGTVVGERGSTLSGGQRQRIAIARALVGRPALLILDEATTALDPETEKAICDTLAALRGSITILAVSHQPAIRLVADTVLELRNGHAFPAAGALDRVGSGS